MRRRLFAFFETLRASYWFVPSVMTVAAIALALGLVYVDNRVGSGWIGRLSWLYANKPDGARTVLSTIAGSMITVAGVTFSITIAAVAYATSQFGPRLLSSFMRDRGNQITLGTFIATFIYCLVVLRTIRAADEPPPGGTQASADLVAAFVPQIAMLAALGLALASTGVFIYFIHHVPEQIHAGRVVARIGRELVQSMEKLFPENGAAPAFGTGGLPDELPDGLRAGAVTVSAPVSGYVQYVDVEALVALACKHDALLRLCAVPGDFAHLSLPLVEVVPGRSFSPALEKGVRGAFTFGPVRTPLQDSRFLLDELAEVSARALSPGVNDPFTAMNCAEWLTAAAVVLAQRPPPQGRRYDDRGRLRLVAPTMDFETLLRRAFDSTRPYVAADRNATLHQLRCFGQIAEAITRDADARALAALAARFYDEARPTLVAEMDRRDADARRDAIFATLHARAAVPLA